MFKVHMPRLLKLNPQQVTQVPRLVEKKTQIQSSFQDESTADVSKLIDASKIIIEQDIQEEDYLHEINQAQVLMLEENVIIPTIPIVLRIDEKLYAEQTHFQNEMILNTKQYMQRQNNAKNMKINALQYELSKVEQRAENMTKELNQHTETVEQIEQKKKKLDDQNAKEDLRKYFDQIEKQINEALEDEDSQDDAQSKQSSDSITQSQLNQDIYKGYVKNEQLFKEMDRIENILHIGPSQQRNSQKNNLSNVNSQMNSTLITNKPQKPIRKYINGKKL